METNKWTVSAHFIRIMFGDKGALRAGDTDGFLPEKIQYGKI